MTRRIHRQFDSTWRK